MFVRKDITDLNPNEILHQMANELLMWDPDVKVGEKSEKKVCENGCPCQDCDDEVGDNVTW
jgi:hypothetical protein